MKKRSVMGVIITLLVLLFVYTAFSKLFDPDAFKGNMYNQRIPHWLAGILTWAIPAVEIGIVVCLFSTRALRLGLICSLTLLSIYTLYIAAILLHFFRRMPCSCGGIFRHMTWEAHLWFNLAFILLAAWGLFLYGKTDHSTRHLFIHQ